MLPLRRLRLDRLVLVWVVLVLATLLTWWLGADHPVVADDGRLAPALALAVAFVKVRLIGRHFMGVRSSPRMLRTLLDVWVVAFGSATVVLVLL